MSKKFSELRDKLPSAAQQCAKTRTTKELLRLAFRELSETLHYSHIPSGNDRRMVDDGLHRLHVQVYEVTK